MESRRHNRLHGDHLAPDQTQALVFTILETAVEQHLHTQTDSQQRFLGCRLLLHHISQPGVLQLLRRIPEGAYPRQDDLLCTADLLRISGQPDIRSDPGEGTHQGEDISDAVINDCDHDRSPFFVNRLFSFYNSFLFRARSRMPARRAAFLPGRNYKTPFVEGISSA